MLDIYQRCNATILTLAYFKETHEDPKSKTHGGRDVYDKKMGANWKSSG